MAKHDRRKPSQPTPKLANGHDLGAVADARRAERCSGSVPWLVHHDRDAGPGGDDGGGSRRPVRPEGAPSGRASRVARRERGQSGDAWRAPSWSTATARSERRRRGAAAELPMGGGHRPAGRVHAGRGRRGGVDAAVCGHVGPGAGGGGGAGESRVSRAPISVRTSAFCVESRVSRFAISVRTSATSPGDRGDLTRQLSSLPGPSQCAIPRGRS